MGLCRGRSGLGIGGVFGRLRPHVFRFPFHLVLREEAEALLDHARAVPAGDGEDALPGDVVRLSPELVLLSRPVAQRQERQVGQQGPVEGGDQGRRHARANLARVVEVVQHLNEPDEGADHAERRGVRARLREEVRHELALALHLRDPLVEHACNLVLPHPIDGHFEPELQEVVVNVVDVPVEGKHPLPPRGAGHVCNLVEAALERRRLEREEVLRHLDDALQVVEGVVNHDGRRRAPHHHQQRGRVEELPPCVAQQDGPGDEDKSTDQADRG